MLGKQLTKWVAKLNNSFALYVARRKESDLVEECNFNTLRQWYKEKNPFEFKQQVHFSVNHSLIGRNVHDMIAMFGKPVFVKKRVRAGVVHGRMVFQTITNWYKARVVVEMINRQVSTVTYTYFNISRDDMESWRNAIGEMHQFNQEYLNLFEFSCRDKAGNRVVCRQHPELQITYIHMDRNIEQSINAAVFFETFTSIKSGMLKEVQLSA